MSVSVLPRPRLAWITAGGLGLLAVLTLLLTTLTAPTAAAVLGSSSSTFEINGEVRAMTTGFPASVRCEGPAATLIPGMTRCLVYTVHNTLDQPIQVQSITMGLDPRFPSPPSGCSAEKLLLPSFSGVLQVPANGHAETAGLPIQLKNTPTTQDNCREKMLHFTFAGTAIYTEPSSPGPRQDLPGTGAALGGLMLGAGLLVSAGWILLAAAQRRRVKASS